MNKFIIMACAIALIAAVPSASAVKSPVTIHIQQGAYLQDSGKGFMPSDLTVKSGARIQWQNDDTVPHTATSGHPNDPSDGRLFNTGQIAPGSTSSMVKINGTPGMIHYFCMIHPFLVGKITVN